MAAARGLVTSARRAGGRGLVLWKHDRGSQAARYVRRGRRDQLHLELDPGLVSDEHPAPVVAVRLSFGPAPPLVPERAVTRPLARIDGEVLPVLADVGGKTG